MFIQSILSLVSWWFLLLCEKIFFFLSFMKNKISEKNQHSFLNSCLNTADVLQRKIPTSCLLPSICCLCYADGDSLNHLFFGCSFSMACWFKLFSIFNLQWVFSYSAKDDVLQLSLDLSFTFETSFTMDQHSQSFDFKIMVREK